MAVGTRQLLSYGTQLWNKQNANHRKLLLWNNGIWLYVIST